MASIYNNLYLSSASNNDKEKAKEYIEKCLHFNKLVHGENSIQVSNCHFIRSNCCLKLGLIDEAIKSMEESIKLFDNQDEELKKAKDEMLLIKVRFFNQYATIFFIKRDFQKAKHYIDQAFSICSDPTNYTYETAESFKKSLTEVEQLRMRCEAKLLGVSCLSLKDAKDQENEKQGTQPGSVAVS